VTLLESLTGQDGGLVGRFLHDGRLVFLNSGRERVGLNICGSPEASAPGSRPSMPGRSIIRIRLRC
jgi:hypothetical protein